MGYQVKFVTVIWIKPLYIVVLPQYSWFYKRCPGIPGISVEELKHSGFSLHLCGGGGGRGRAVGCFF